MNKSIKSSISKASVLMALLAGAWGAEAAGLGKLMVYSGIGQPLNAEVALTATAQELNSLSARLASHEAFREAGIDFMPVLSGLQFSIEKQAGGEAAVKLTTLRPINEPFLHFLVELNWPSGRMVREYTFLLDPPEMLQVAKAASVVAPAVPAIGRLADAPRAATAATGKVAAASAGPSRTAPTATAGRVASPEYTVKRGDTLAKIARENRPEAVGLDQMLVALFNGNRDAFDGNNMNRLRAGKILRIPDAADLARVDAAEARKLIIGQTTEFEAYRRRLAHQAGGAAAADQAPKQQVTGTIKPQVEDKTPPAPARDKLEVSRTEPPSSAKAAGSAKSTASGGLEEDLISRDKALREAAERIALLEKNIENLKQLVEVKSQGGAKLQQESQGAAPSKEDKPPVPVPAPARPDEAVKSAPPADAAPAARPAEPVPPPAKPAVKAPPVVSEPGFLEENPQIAYGGGGAIALLLAYLGYGAWRRKKQAAETASPSAGVPASQIEPRAAGAGLPPVVGMGLDNTELSIQGDFGENSVLTTEEIVDPVAEADVLMAYGRDRQAEEILLEGLRKDATRAGIHMKLLELYAKQENIAQFESIAGELHRLNNGRGADWERVQGMARGLGLSGGIFMTAEAVAASAEAVEAIQPFGAVEAPSPFAPLDVVIEPSIDASIEAPIEATPADEDKAAESAAFAGVAAVPAVGEEPGEIGDAIEPSTTTGELSATAGEPAAEPLAMPEAVEASSLDFDLDLGTTSMASQPVPMAVGEPLPPEDEAAGIDFDFDLGSAEAAQTAEGAEGAPSAAAQSDADQATGGMADFDLDLGTPVEAQVVDSFANLDASNEAGMVDVVSPGTEDPSAVAPAFDETLLAPEALDTSSLDFDLELGEPAAEDADAAIVTEAAEMVDMADDMAASMAPAAVPAIDLTDISLDLDVLDANEQPAAVEVGQIAEPAADIDFALDLDAPPIESQSAPVASDMSDIQDMTIAPVGEEVMSDTPEVITKLELAKAYEEMGDLDGARELLNEAASLGSPAQQAQILQTLERLNA